MEFIIYKKFKNAFQIITIPFLQFLHVFFLTKSLYF